MRKVEFESVVGVDGLIDNMEGKVGFTLDDIRSYIVENGSGVYEFIFGDRGLEDFVKNDEYLEIDDVIELSGESVDSVLYFYSDDEHFVEMGEESWCKCFNYFEDWYSVFVNVKV